MRNLSVISVVLVLAAVLISGVYGYVSAYSKATSIDKVCLALEDSDSFTEGEMKQLSEDAGFVKVPTLQQACDESNRAYNYYVHQRTVLVLEICLCLVVAGVAVFVLRREE